MRESREVNRICPISRRDLFMCTDMGYRYQCRQLRDRLARQTGGMFDYCGDGAGVVKDEVAVFNQADKAEEKTMGEQKKWSGKCESCEEKKTLTTHFGKGVCSMCMTMRIVAKKNPKAVIKALMEFGGLEKNEEMVVGQSAVPQDVLAENRALKEELDSLKADLAEYMQLIDEYKTKVQADKQSADVMVMAEIGELKEKLAENEGLRKSLAERNSELDKEVAELRDKVQKLSSSLAEKEMAAGNLSEFSVGRLRDLAWKLADGVMDGSISGVTVDDIRVLREAA